MDGDRENFYSEQPAPPIDGHATRFKPSYYAKGHVNVGDVPTHKKAAGLRPMTEFFTHYRRIFISLTELCGTLWRQHAEIPAH